MTDDAKKIGLDRQLISLGEPQAVRSWAEALKCSEEQLKAAVGAVGSSAEKVREYLKRSD